MRLGNIAMLLSDAGDLAGAHALLERAVAIESAAYGPTHPVVAGRQRTLAAVRTKLGER
jgi:hypothetical protein